MELCLEAPFVRTSRSSPLELRGHGGREELLCFDFRHLHVAMRVTVQQQLRANEIRQILEDRGIIRRKRREDRGLGRFHAGLCESVIELGHQRIELRDKFNQALWEDDDAIVFTRDTTLLDHVRKLNCDVFEASLVTVNFLADEACVRPCQQGHLQGDVGGGTAHEADDVVVLLCAQSVHSDVAHECGVGLASSVESEGNRNVRRAL
mmetsp:Transcript_103908/g.299100  ORF Transcript_103908/g.299100 Transcript_103908/m.299100 type:complete len:207 (-) Transcript_103908:738-1358(-)